MEKVEFIGLQYNLHHTSYIPLVNNKIGSTVRFNPHLHRITNVDYYNDMIFRESMLKNTMRGYDTLSWMVAL